MSLIPTTAVPEDYRRRLAYKLMMEGTDSSPVQHWAQGLGRMGQAALGGYQMYQADEKDKASERESAQAYAALLGGAGLGAPQAAPATPEAPPMPTPSRPMSNAPAPVASADPQASTGPRPGGPVMPTAKVWGDAEAEAAGLYEPAPKNVKLASALSAPQGGDPAALPPAALPAQGYAIPGQPQTDPRKAQIVRMLQSDNPAERKMGKSLADSFVANEMAPKTTDEIREFEYNKKNPEFAKYKTDLKKAGATNVTTNTNVGGGSDKQVFDAMDESAKGARATATGLTGLREARNAIQGGAITGAGADARLALQKVGSLVGVADPSKIVNTETFRAAIAPQVAAVLKSTVGTANISNTDREFAEKAAGGNINLDEKSITRLLDIMERASTSQLEAHQKKVDKIYADPEKFGRERALFGVDMPPAPLSPKATQPAATSKPTVINGYTIKAR